jgi:hypothetical protein
VIVGFCCGFLARVKPDIFWFVRAEGAHA